MTYLLAHLPQLGTQTLQHVTLVFAALAIALCVAVPLGTIAAKLPRSGAPLFGTLGMIYAIPSLAALAILVQYVGLGAWPVIIVLAAYAQFILVRNIAAGLNSVPAAASDAAAGLGMSPAQRFWRVELPLASPIVLGGIRLTTVALISIATLGGYVGAGGLGEHIFFGLQRQYVDETLAGSVPVALLAIVADLFFRGLERLARRRITG